MIRSRLLIFGERSEWIAPGHSCLVSNLSASLTSLFKKEGLSKSLIFVLTYKNMILFKFFEGITHFLWVKERMSNSLKKKHWFAHSLFCYERPDRFAHGPSFVMSDLSNLRTAAHLSWMIWANLLQSLIKMSDFEPMSNWAMSRWANSQPWLRVTNCM